MIYLLTTFAIGFQTVSYFQDAEEGKTASGLTAAWMEVQKGKDGVALRKFTLHVEAELGVDIPDEWKEWIWKTKFHADSFRLAYPRNKPIEKKTGVGITKGFSVIQSNGEWIIEGQGVSVPLKGFQPRTTQRIGQFKFSPGFMSVLPADDGGIFLAGYHDLPGPFPICKLTKKGEVLWCKTITCGEEAWGGTGFVFADLSMNKNKSTLFLFGQTAQVGFVKGIDRKTGRVQFSFLIQPRK